MTRLFEDFSAFTDEIRQVWESRELIEWEDRKVWTVSREGLIDLKKLSGRDQDLLDIKKLSEVNSES